MFRYETRCSIKWNRFRLLKQKSRVQIRCCVYVLCYLSNYNAKIVQYLNKIPMKIFENCFYFSRISIFLCRGDWQKTEEII